MSSLLYVKFRMVSGSLFLSCLPGVKALLHVSNTLEENDMPRKLLLAEQYHDERVKHFIKVDG